MTGKRIRDFGFVPGRLPTGPRNKLSDVPGVRVGHCTVDDGHIRSGVSVVVPAQDNVFLNKLTAAGFVHNGFGKTVGLMQLDELGTLETPIALTGTMNVGLVADALVQYSLLQCRKEGYDLRSVNPVVGECNDGNISDIASRPVRVRQVFHAIADAREDFDEGDVGAGRGTVCYGLKGGIGSASRVVDIGDSRYTVGVLVQSNFGTLENLVICGRPVGLEIAAKGDFDAREPDKGSIMMVLATDLPVDARQLRRIIRRCAMGLGSIGSFTGNGSGEVMLGFTTANRVPHLGAQPLRTCTVLRDELLDGAFQAAAESTAEAVLNSMTAASTTVSHNGRLYRSLSEFL